MRSHIPRGRELDFSIGEIRVLLNIAQPQWRARDEGKTVAAAHLELNGPSSQIGRAQRRPSTRLLPVRAKGRVGWLLGTRPPKGEDLSPGSLFAPP